MHSDNRPPTLHGEDRTHTATDTQRHLSLHPGPCGGGQAVGQEPATGGGFFLWWDISAASQGRRRALPVMKHPPSLAGARLISANQGSSLSQIQW